MRTAIEFYREAVLQDLLRQQEEFLSFAAAHLLFYEEKEYIGVLRELRQDSALLEQDRWVKRLEDELFDDPQILEKLTDTREAVARCFAASAFPEPEEEARFLAVVTLMILISKLETAAWQGASPEALRDAYLGKSAAEAENKTLRFGGETVIELPLGDRPYVAAFQPDYPMEEQQEIVTYILQAASVGMYEAVRLDLGGERTLKIPRGGRLLVNVVKDTIVSILPNKLALGGTILARKADGTMFVNGQRCPQSQEVTAFAIQAHTGLYFWSEQGNLDGSYLDVYPKCGKWFRRIVEVAFSGEYYYLLSANGILESNDPIRNRVKGKLASLGALKEELRT